MATIPSIAMIPSGYKANKVYSVLPTDGSGDLDFARTSIATRVNENRLIETMATGVPRLDYTDGSCPSLLLEPASINLITQSEAFSNNYWTKSGASIEGDASTAGSELIDANASVFSGTSIYSWSSYGSNTVINVSNQLEITNIDNSFGASYPLRNSGDLSTDLIVGQLYKLEFRGSSSVDLNSSLLVSMAVTNTDAPLFTTTPKDYIIYFVAQGATSCNLRMQGMSINEVITLDNISVKEVQGFSAPSVDSPLGAFKLVEDTTTGLHRISVGLGPGSAGSYTLSYRVKYDSLQWIRVYGGFGSSDYNAYFDILNKVIGTASAGLTSTKIVELADGWLELSISAPFDTLGNVVSYLYLADGDGVPSYTGSGRSVLVFGAQHEQQSSATSYIPTAGTIISRTADSASKSGISSLINSSEGVFYAEISGLSNDGTFKVISLSDGGSTNNVVRFYKTTTENQISIRVTVGGVHQLSAVHTLSDSTDINKMALKYKENDFAFWVNGIEVVTHNSGTTFTVGTLNKLALNDGAGNSGFYGNCKDLRVFKTALTDAELTTLTTL